MSHLILRSVRTFFFFFAGAGVLCPTTLALHRIALTDTNTGTQQFDSSVVISSEGGASGGPTWVEERAPGRRAYFDIHIPKTAGTSFKMDLPKVLPNGEGFWTNERCLVDPVMKKPGDGDVAFFREPVAHVYSQFLECRYTRWGRVARRRSSYLRNWTSDRAYFENVTAWLKHFRGGAERDDFGCYHPYNMQTRALTCSVPADRIGGSHHLNREPSKDFALSNLNSLFFFGLTEHYQASLCLFHAKTHNDTHNGTRSPLPEFCNCANESAWNSIESHHGDHGVPAHSVDDLSQEDIGLIEEMTQKDAEIYREASRVFMREISEVERDYETKLVC